MTNRKKRASDMQAGAYALNALDEEERREYEAALSRSETLRAEMAELQDTAVLLGLAAEPVEPPAYLRTRVLAQIENTPQLSAEPEQASRQSMASRFAFWRPNLLPTVLSVAGAVAVLGIAGSVLTNLPTSSAAPNTVAAISSASDSQNAQVQAGLANRVNVVWSSDMHEAAVKVDDSNLVWGDAYQLWLVDKGGVAHSAGLIQKGTKDWVVLNGTLHKGDSIAMTVEPLGGSKQPTTRALFKLSV